jgi:hypothetical protein
MGPRQRLRLNLNFAANRKLDADSGRGEGLLGSVIGTNNQNSVPEKFKLAPV